MHGAMALVRVPQVFASGIQEVLFLPPMDSPLPDNSRRQSAKSETASLRFSCARSRCTFVATYS
jgi:hypothetical protein